MCWLRLIIYCNISIDRNELLEPTVPNVSLILFHSIKILFFPDCFTTCLKNFQEMDLEEITGEIILKN